MALGAREQQVRGSALHDGPAHVCEVFPNYYEYFGRYLTMRSARCRLSSAPRPLMRRLCAHAPLAEASYER
eukprot:1735272-Prymnesium_polylepis.1